MSGEGASSKEPEIFLQALGKLPTIQVSEYDCYAIEQAISRRVPKSSERESILADLRLLWQRLEKLLDAMIANIEE